MNEKRFDPARIEKLDNPQRRQQLPPERLLDLLPFTGSGDILDVGAGSGYFTFPASKRTDGTVYALDAQEQMLDVLSRRKQEQQADNVTIIQGEAEHIPMEAESVDCVICSMVLHEVDPLEQGIQEIWRVLRQGGSVLCIEWEHIQTESGPKLNHRIPSADMANILQAQGFKNIQHQAWGEALYSLTFQKPIRLEIRSIE